MAVFVRPRIDHTSGGSSHHAKARRTLTMQPLLCLSAGTQACDVKKRPLEIQGQHFLPVFFGDVIDQAIVAATRVIHRISRPPNW